jgi:RimJ/RimL family protein N-acetyltransferase
MVLRVDKIETPRIILRLHKDTDAKAFLEAEKASRTELAPWFSWAKSETLEDVKGYFSYLNNTYNEPYPRQFHFFIFNKDTDKFIGSVNFFRVDWDIPYFYLAYWMDTREAGKGYMTEAVNALTRACFGIYNAKRVQISASIKNPKSLRIPEKLKYNLEGELRNYSFIFDTKEVTNSLMYACSNTDMLPDLDVTWIVGEDMK